VDGAGHQLLAAAALALDQNGALTEGDGGEDVEQLAHPGTATDDVLAAVPAFELLAQLLYLTEVPEGLRPSDGTSPLVSQNRRGDTDRHPAATAIDDVYRTAHHGLAAFHGLTNRAGALTGSRLEHIGAVLPEGVLPGHPGDALRCPVEGSDAPIPVDGEHAIGDRVEYD
jgi:hypothetical protein